MRVFLTTCRFSFNHKSIISFYFLHITIASSIIGEHHWMNVYSTDSFSSLCQFLTRIKNKLLSKQNKAKITIDTNMKR